MYRALELLDLLPSETIFLLNFGCDSGLSEEILDKEGYVCRHRHRTQYTQQVHLLPLFNREFTCTSEVALEWEVEDNLFLQDIGRASAFSQEALKMPLGSRHSCPFLLSCSLYFLCGASLC